MPSVEHGYKHAVRELEARNIAYMQGRIFSEAILISEKLKLLGGKIFNVSENPGFLTLNYKGQFVTTLNLNFFHGFAKQRSRVVYHICSFVMSCSLAHISYKNIQIGILFRIKEQSTSHVATGLMFGRSIKYLR